MTKTGNTERFINRLSYPHTGFNLNQKAIPPVGEPVVLVVPSYQHEDEVVADFCVDRWQDVVGVIGVGNRAFGGRFCWAARNAAVLSDSQLLARVEVFGTPEEVSAVNDKLNKLDERD